jgi:ubiquinone/menaquinone biosynthesis C-methylase UbiE
MTDYQEIAKHLRKPEGERGFKIAQNMNVGNTNTYAKMKKHLQLSANTKVLEIGFGNGVTSKEIIASCNYVGVDYSADMVSLAQQLCADEMKNGAKFMQGDVHQLPFDDHSFDIIFTINTIYFWDVPEKAIAELRRVLKPNGKLYVGMRTKEDMHLLNNITQHNFNIRSFVEIEELIRDGGFNEVMYTVYSDAPAIKANGEVLRVHSVILQAE